MAVDCAAPPPKSFGGRRIWRGLCCALISMIGAGGAIAAAPSRPLTAPATNTSDSKTARPLRRRGAPVPVAAPLATTPIPGVAAQREVLAKVREIYALDYADESFAARRALARRLIDASTETKRDSDAKFVLLREARDVAAQVGDVTTAFEAIDVLTGTFPVTKLHERTDALRTAIPALGAPASNLAATSICVDLSEQSIIEGDYDRADELLALAGAAAKQGKSVSFYNWVQSRIEGLKPLRAAYEAARPAEATLARSPGDPQANLVMGQFVCFVKSDFDAGLPMLARGADARLAALADHDLDVDESDGAARLALANEWWTISDSSPPTTATADEDRRLGARRRAAFWYGRAISRLDGLDRALAERRIAQVESETAARLASARKIPRPPDALKLMPGHSYRVSLAEVSWDTARQLCEQAGGRLVCIETRAEGDLMTRLARGRTLWLGASVNDTGRWSWLSGAGEFFFSNWNSGEPSDLTVAAHPVIAEKGAWRTLAVGKAGFICEWTE